MAVPVGGGYAPRVEGVVYRSYPVRWAILLGCMLLVAGSHIAWLTYVPVNYKAAEWIGGDYANHVEKIDYFGTINFPISFVFGFLGAWAFDKYGSYLPLMVGGWTLTPAMALRVVASYIDDPDTRYYMILVAQAIVGVSISMVSLSPTKIAAVWFSEKQRLLANTMVTLMLPGGILFAYVISPQIVNAFTETIEVDNTTGINPKLLGVIKFTNEDGTVTVENYDQSFKWLNWLYFAWNLTGTLLITIFMRHPGVPPTPASPTSLDKVLPFWQGVKTALTDKYYIMLCAVMSCGLAVISILMVSLPSIMCPWGYSAAWANSWGIVILITSGTVSSTVLSILAAKYPRKLEWFLRVLFVGCLITMLVFTWFLTQEPNYPVFGVVTAFMGITSYPTLPLAYELSVETTYPVGPATSAGLNWIISSLMAFLMEFVYQPLKRAMPIPENPEDAIVNNCKSDAQDELDYDYRISLLGIIGVTIVCGVIWLFFYRCPYKRANIDAARRAADEKKTHENSDSMELANTNDSPSSDSGKDNSAFKED